MRTHDSSEPTTPQAEKFDEMTGGYDDIDHARAAKRINADIRAMDATPRGKHTPGPLFYEPHHKDFMVFDESGIACVAIVHGGVADGKGNDASEANAKLFTAAPELLEMCQRILLRLDLEPKEAVFPCSAMREDIRAAIARATR